MQQFTNLASELVSQEEIWERHLQQKEIHNVHTSYKPTQFNLLILCITFLDQYTPCTKEQEYSERDM